MYQNSISVDNVPRRKSNFFQIKTVEKKRTGLLRIDLDPPQPAVFQMAVEALNLGLVDSLRLLHRASQVDSHYSSVMVMAGLEAANWKDMANISIEQEELRLGHKVTCFQMVSKYSAKDEQVFMVLPASELGLLQEEEDYAQLAQDTPFIVIGQESLGGALPESYLRVDRQLSWMPGQALRERIAPILNQQMDYVNTLLDECEQEGMETFLDRKSILMGNYQKKHLGLTGLLSQNVIEYIKDRQLYSHYFVGSQSQSDCSDNDDDSDTQSRKSSEGKSQSQKSSDDDNTEKKLKGEKKEEERKVVIKQSPNDKRKLKYVTMSNGMRVLLVNDQESDKSAVCLSIAVGSMRDYPEVGGLAHFLEHMMYLGSKEYPEKNAFSEFLANHGSEDDNAYTQDDSTVFYYDIANENLEESLERFGALFSHPLLSESGVEQEKNAVESEYVQSLQSDAFRRESLKAHLTDSEHPYSRFTMGSLKSFDHPDLYKLVQQFHQEFYSANLMNLVVVSQASLDDQEEYVQKYFSEVKDQGLPRQVLESPYQESHLQKMVRLESVKEKDLLQVLWVLPYQRDRYPSMSGQVIEHLLALENKHSLLSLLKDLTLATDLEAGMQHNLSAFSELHVNIKLTKAGLADYPRVIRYLVSYIQVLQQTGIPEELVTEFQAMQLLHFNHQEKQAGVDYACYVAEQMLYYPVQDVNTAETLLTQVDLPAVNALVHLLQASNMNVILQSKGLQTPLDRHYAEYNLDYSFLDLSPDILAMFQQSPLTSSPNKTLALPEPNPFLPPHTEVSPCLSPGDLSQVLASSCSRLWHKQDIQFKSAKGYIQLVIYYPEHPSSEFQSDPGISDCVKKSVCLDIYETVLRAHMNEYLYDAKVLDYTVDLEIKPACNSLIVTLHGFSSNLGSLLTHILQQLVRFGEQPLDYLTHQFDMAKEVKTQDARNKDFDKPYRMASRYKHQVLSGNASFSVQERRQAVQDIDLAYFQTFTKSLLSSVATDWLVTGNYTEEEALQLVGVSESLLAVTLPHDSLRVHGCKKVGSHHLTEHALVPENSDQHSAFHLVVQAPLKSTLAQEVKMKLLDQLLGEMFFDALRTEQQLGYTVFAHYDKIRKTDFFNFVVQSNILEPNGIEERVADFILKALEELEDMDEKEFKELKKGLEVIITANYNNLVEEAEDYAREIERQTFRFDKKQQQKKVLKSLSQDELLEFYDQLFVYNQGRLEIHVVCHQHAQEHEESLAKREKVTLVRDIPALRATLGDHP